MIFEALDYAITQKADILLTPEGSLSGYFDKFDQKKVEQNLKEILNRAKSTKLGLTLGTCFREADGQRYNEIRFYDKAGTFLGFHCKILRYIGDRD